VNLLVLRKPLSSSLFCHCDDGEFGMKGIRWLSVVLSFWYASTSCRSANRCLIDLFMISWLIEVVVDDVIELSSSIIILCILRYLILMLGDEVEQSRIHLKLDSLVFIISTLSLLSLAFTLLFEAFQISLRMAHFPLPASLKLICKETMRIYLGKLFLFIRTQTSTHEKLLKFIVIVAMGSFE
jgi:hypothetical protein